MLNTSIIVIATLAMLKMAEMVSKAFAYGCAVGCLFTILILFVASRKDDRDTLAEQEKGR